MWNLWVFTFRLDWIHFIKGLEFFRCIENGWFLEYFGDILDGKDVLDIGPWKSPLPMYLSSKGVKVHVLDVNDGLVVQNRYTSKTKLKINTYSMPYFKGGEKIKFQNVPSESMDIITIISTIEHFEGDGDLDIMSEIHRILRPGGFVYISVPYSLRYMEDHVHYQWTEKRYNLLAINERLRGDKFEKLKEFYFNDPRTQVFTRIYWSIPKLFRTLIGRVWIIPALIFSKTDDAYFLNATLSGVVLKKK
jgi:SAM-dependent methyltransferase